MRKACPPFLPPFPSPQAASAAPSIIFLDELDALVPSRSIRSSTSDQIHASIVSVLLVLMDGLADRGQVLVIGATNRPDSIDHALRRPGRFDREVYFSLPSAEERVDILRACTRKWRPEPEEEMLMQLAEQAEGMAGGMGVGCRGEGGGGVQGGELWGWGAGERMCRVGGGVQGRGWGGGVAGEREGVGCKGEGVGGGVQGRGRGWCAGEREGVGCRGEGGDGVQGRGLWVWGAGDRVWGMGCKGEGVRGRLQGRGRGVGCGVRLRQGLELWVSNGGK